MKNSGKQLEQLIKEIEQRLLPEGFNVDLNNRVFNEDGVQLAEFDIVITGKLGSSSIKWLIECRDRPSQGAAPGSWIEQLAGRKARFNFQQVIAVSTTGFAKGVKDFAERSGITLRTVNKITDISSDFRVKGFEYIAQEVRVVGPIEVKTADPDDSHDSVQFLLPNIRFKLAGESEYQSIQDFIVKQVDPNPFGVHGDSKIRFDFWYNGLIDMLLNGARVQITNLTIPVEILTLIYNSKVLAVSVYSEGDRKIGQEANFDFELPTGNFSFPVRILSKPDGMEEISFIVPENIPDSKTLNLLHSLEEND